MNHHLFYLSKIKYEVYYNMGSIHTFFLVLPQEFEYFKLKERKADPRFYV